MRVAAVTVLSPSCCMCLFAGVNYVSNSQELMSVTTGEVKKALRGLAGTLASGSWLISIQSGWWLVAGGSLCCLGY